MLWAILVKYEKIARLEKTKNILKSNSNDNKGHADEVSVGNEAPVGNCLKGHLC